MPASLVAQQVGERLRELRTAQNLSVRTLAARAGFSASFISQVELGQASPSIDSLERIASALDMTLSAFFTQPVGPDPSVVNVEDRQMLSSSWSRAAIEALSPVGADRQLEAVMVTFEPGGRSGAQPYTHARDEFAIVFDGQVVLTLGEAAHIMGRGDAVSIPAGTQHHWRNAGPELARVVMVSTRLAPTALATGGEA